MDGEKGTSLTRREFEAVIKRASELATSDPEGGEGELAEGELFWMAREVGLPDYHVRRALSELRTVEDPEGIVARWFGSVTVRVSRVVGGRQGASPRHHGRAPRRRAPAPAGTLGVR